MLSIIYVQLNIVGMGILLTLFIFARRHGNVCFADQKLFTACVVSCAALMLLDTVIYCLEGRVFPGARALQTAVSALFVMLEPIPCMLWSLYADYKIHGNAGRFRRLLPFLGIPVAANTVLALVSIPTGLLFYIGSGNLYSRGPLFMLVAAFCYSYLVYSAIQIVFHRKLLDPGEFRSMLLFILPPFIGSVVQVAFYGISLTWICVMISLLIIFVNMQNQQLYIDHLTGLYNRRQLDNYLRLQIMNEGKGGILAGIMLDIDKLKEINDLHGHAVGDEALEKAGQILKRSMRKDDFVARYGGDEFIVILTVSRPEDIRLLIERIRENVRRFNEEGNPAYKISFSMGYDFLEERTSQGVQRFLRSIDSLMYQDKNARITCP